MCLLRKNPQDLPYSGALFVVVLSVDVLVTIAINGVSAPASHAVIMAIVATLIVIAITYAALAIARKPGRSMQTLTAIFGTDVILGAPAIVLRYWFDSIPQGTSADF